MSSKAGVVASTTLTSQSHFASRTVSIDRETSMEQSSAPSPIGNRRELSLPCTCQQQPQSLSHQPSPPAAVSLTSPLWHPIAEDSDTLPPPLPPRPQLHLAAPSAGATLKLRSCVKRSGQRLKKAIGICKSLPPTTAPTVSSPEAGQLVGRSLTSRRLSLPASDFDRRSLPKPMHARRGSEGALNLSGKKPLSRRALPLEPVAGRGTGNNQPQVSGRHPASGQTESSGAKSDANQTSPFAQNGSELQDCNSAELDSSFPAMAAPPIAPRPAHTLTEKSSSGSSGYSSRGQSPAHHHAASTTSSDLSPEGPRRQCKESISLPISHTSSSDHLSPPFSSRGRRGSQDSGTQSLEQSPTSQKGMKAGLRRMVGTLKRGATTPKKKLGPDACLSPPTPDMALHNAWPSVSAGGVLAQATASDEALIRAHRAATAACSANGTGHAPLQRCSAAAAGGTRPLVASDRAAMPMPSPSSSAQHGHSQQHPHQHHHHPHHHQAHHHQAHHQHPHHLHHQHLGNSRRDLQTIGRAHSLPVHPVHTITHHSQANRQLSGGHLDQAVGSRKVVDHNAKYRAFDWFFGRMSREQAQRLLTDYGKAGNYLLRERDTCPGEYAISVKARQTVLHFRVYCDNHGYLCNKDASSCPTLIDLVRYHTTVPLTGNSNGSDGVFYLERPLNRSLIPASEGIPGIANSSLSLCNSISRQNSSDLQDINEELYLEPLPSPMSPSGSEASKADETEEEDREEELAEATNGGVYIDEEDERESEA